MLCLKASAMTVGFQLMLCFVPSDKSGRLSSSSSTATSLACIANFIFCFLLRLSIPPYKTIQSNVKYCFHQTGHI